MKKRTPLSLSEVPMASKESGLWGLKKHQNKLLADLNYRKREQSRIFQVYIEPRRIELQGETDADIGNVGENTEDERCSAENIHLSFMNTESKKCFSAVLEQKI